MFKTFKTNFKTNFDCFKIELMRGGLTLAIVICLGIGIILINSSTLSSRLFGWFNYWVGCLSIYYLSYKFFQPESPTFMKNNNQNKREEEIKNHKSSLL